jgi:2-amino-4-hydroxy-6-hydroxymethyldihydropteridine diphosphokinase
LSPRTYVGFGSNLGDRRAKFDAALSALAALPCTTVTGFSALYETAPVGLCDNGSSFLNAAISLDTTLSAADLFAGMQAIELSLGKSPEHRSDQSRSIDLDLLMYGAEAFRSNGIEAPHPRMHLRAFVLVPLREIAAGVVHPSLGKTIEELTELLPASDLVGVIPWDERPSDGQPAPSGGFNE